MMDELERRWHHILAVADGIATVNLQAGPNFIFPYEGKPGCLDAIRAKLEALGGCLAFALERALWMGLGAVIGVLVMRGCGAR